MDYSNKNPELLRAILMDNFEYPTQKIHDLSKVNLEPYLMHHNKSSTCIDDLTVYVLTENDIIKDVKFSGLGCAISTSSTNIITKLLINKPIKQAYNIIENYKAMINEKPYDEMVLEDLIAFYNIPKQPNRIKCALIGVDAVQTALFKGENHE